MTQPSRLATAIHEAGHAVVGRAVTLPCGGASIVPDDDFGAYGMAHVGTADQAWREWKLREKFRDYTSACRARALAAMAGHEAELQILGEAVGCDDDDRATAAAEIWDLGLPEGDEAIAEARLRRAARQLVRRHWTDIVRVAAALEASETLTGEEIDALLPPGFMARPVTWPPEPDEDEGEPSTLT